MENKVGIVKDENNRIIGAFAMIVDDNGIPTMIGSIHEPVEVVTCTEEQLMQGLHQLPQEFLQTVSQNTEYEPPAYIEETEEPEYDLLEEVLD